MAEQGKAGHAAQGAEHRAVELMEGARVRVDVTVYEDTVGNAKGEKRLFVENPVFHGKERPIQSRVEDGKRYITIPFCYPFPAGLIEDPWTKKPAVTMSPSELGVAIGHWLKQVDELKAAGGHFVTKQRRKDGTEFMAAGKDPLDCIPTPADIFQKGFKLEIQGPVNGDLAKAVIKKVGGAPSAVSTKSASASVEDFG